MYNTGIAFGMFDMISLLKVEFLNEASRNCGLLTVGVLSDSAIKQIMGEEPMVDEEYRIKIVEELKSVSKVVLINDIDMLKALSEEFDTYFLCDDIKDNIPFASNRNHVDIKAAYKSRNINSYLSVPKSKGIVGYTTGVYDLFHIGHLNLLKKAKDHCESLIVGVSTDELVEEYKNKRPNMSFLERIQIIENLKCVDAVVVQETMDKFEAWKNLKFDIMFHGDDWKGSSVYLENERKLKAVGVEMIYFPYTKGVSSTILSDKILAK